ncbi:MAG: hypothetical protein AB1631_31675 [Acidobacteriota bacterium]
MIKENRNHKLKPGEKVRMTERGIGQGLDGRRKRRTGIIVSIPVLNPAYIYVRLDGLKRPTLWSAAFWEADR